MTRKQFLSWGKAMHYPQLVLSSGQVLRCGVESYTAATREQVRLAGQRIAMWDAKFIEERVS